MTDIVRNTGATFSTQTFSQRFQAMGDEAEGVFEAVYPEGFVKYGLSRPPIHLASVPPFIRFTPDYLTAKGLVEVQGLGRDRTFKLKISKWTALEEWASHFRVDLFVWDRTDSRYGFIRLHELSWALDEDGEWGAFDDGANPYKSLHVDQLPVVEWVNHGV